jgi:hypothetical protein
MSLKAKTSHYTMPQRWVAMINNFNRSIAKEAIDVLADKKKPENITADERNTTLTNTDANDATLSINQKNGDTASPKTYKTWEIILVFIYDYEVETLRWCPAYVVGQHANNMGQKCFSVEVLKWRSRPDAGYIWEVKEEDTQTMTEFRPIKRWTDEQMISSVEDDGGATKGWDL